MNAKNSILFLTLFFLANSGFSQTRFLLAKEKKTFVFNPVEIQPQVNILIVPNYFNGNNFSKTVISPNYYTQHFGFFCKQELQLEKKTRIPFKFRLGSVEACDRLEGKYSGK